MKRPKLASFDSLTVVRTNGYTVDLVDNASPSWLFLYRLAQIEPASVFDLAKINETTVLFFPIFASNFQRRNDPL